MGYLWWPKSLSVDGSQKFPACLDPALGRSSSVGPSHSDLRRRPVRYFYLRPSSLARLWCREPPTVRPPPINPLEGYSAVTVSDVYCPVSRRQRRASDRGNEGVVTVVVGGPLGWVTGSPRVLGVPVPQVRGSVVVGQDSREAFWDGRSRVLDRDRKGREAGGHVRRNVNARQELLRCLFIFREFTTQTHKQRPGPTVPFLSLVYWTE